MCDFFQPNHKKWDKYYFWDVNMLFKESVNDETMKPSELGNRQFFLYISDIRQSDSLSLVSDIRQSNSFTNLPARCLIFRQSDSLKKMHSDSPYFDILIVFKKILAAKTITRLFHHWTEKKQNIPNKNQTHVLPIYTGMSYQLRHCSHGNTGK